ncbi:LysR family transcriptional regulator [Massilia sp. TN1-12]|uniref:LysR family transcriptional regulator n=1 Tax=Massilia paldalensis TaxID=3377675 RepID=UPI00384AD09C
MNADWNDYRVFLAIARHGTLSEAARRLGLSQPTMGRRLQALEDALARPLFQRTADGYVLTIEGQSVLANIERMEEQATAVERKLAGESELEGLVRVSTTEWFGVHLLAPILAGLRIDYPGLAIELVTETRLVSLARREADLSFRFREFEEPDVVQVRAVALDFGAYASQAYLERCGLPRDGDGKGNGKNHTLITMDTGFGTLADVAWLTGRLPDAAIGLRANSRDVQARLCAAGAGIAVLPRCVGDASANLVLLDLGEAPPGRTVWAGYHKDMKRSPRVRAVLDAALRGLAPP